MEKVKTEDVAHEVLSSTPIQALTVDQKVAQEITKFNVARAELAKLKEVYLPLLQLDLTEKKNYNLLKAAVGDLRDKRNRLEDKRKEINGEAQDFIKGVNGEAKELTRLIVEMEEPLKKAKDDIDNAEKIRKAKEEEEREKVLHNRIDLLIANGMSYNGSYYTIDQIAQDVVTIKTMDDTRFNELLGAVKVVNERLLEEKRLKEEEEKAAALAIQKQKEENERIQKEQEEAAKKLKEQQEELKKQQEAIKQQTLSLRTQQLAALGFTRTLNDSLKVSFAISEKAIYGFECPIDAIADYTNEKWETTLADIKKDVEYNRTLEAKYLQELEEEKQKKIEAEKEQVRLAERKKARVQQLFDRFGMKPADMGYQRNSTYEGVSLLFLNEKHLVEKTDEEWAKVIMDLTHYYDSIIMDESVKQQKIDDDIAAKKAAAAEVLEKERQAKLSDAQRMTEYLNLVKVIVLGKDPEFKEDGEFYHDVEALKDMVEKMWKRSSTFGTQGEPQELNF